MQVKANIASKGGWCEARSGPFIWLKNCLAPSNDPWRGPTYHFHMFELKPQKSALNQAPEFLESYTGSLSRRGRSKIDPTPFLWWPPWGRFEVPPPSLACCLWKTRTHDVLSIRFSFCNFLHLDKAQNELHNTSENRTIPPFFTHSRWLKSRSFHHAR